MPQHIIEGLPCGSASCSRRGLLAFRFVVLLVFMIACLLGVTRLHAQTAYAADAKANAIEGTAVVEACTGCLSGNRVGNIGNGNANYLRIKGITVPTTGTYTVALYYLNGSDGGSRSFTLQINNGAGPTLSNLTGNSWSAPVGPVIFQAAFTAGNTNSVGFFNATDPAPNVDHIVVSANPIEVSNASTTLTPTVYEGDASINTLGGTAVIENCSACLDTKRVGMLGNGSANFVTIKGITVPSTGIYSVTLYYVEGSDGGTRGFDVKFGDGSDLSLNNLTGSSWDAPSTPVTFLASFTAGSSNSLTFLNANGSAPDLDHIVVSGTSNTGNSGGSTGGNSGSGGGASFLPPDLAANLIYDYVPGDKCTFSCTFMIMDKKNNAVSVNWNENDLDINNSSGSGFCWIGSFCQFDYIKFKDNTLSLPLAPANISIKNQGVTFLLKVYTLPHVDAQNNPLTGDAVTAIGQVGNPVFSMRTIGNQWAVHSYQQGLLSPSPGFDVTSPEPNNYPGNEKLYEDIYYTFTPDGRLTIDKFTPFTTPPLPAVIKTFYNWEESVFDEGWPYTWNSDGSRNFTPISRLILGGWPGPSAGSPDSFRELAVFNTALNNQQMIDLENSSHNAGVWLNTKMVPCNTGRWMNQGRIDTPCDGVFSSSKGGDQNPVQTPYYPITGGFNSGTDSFAPTSFTADDSNFNFTLSYNPPSQYPPLGKIQDPTQPPAWSPFFPVTPYDYTLYLLTQDSNGIHQCQAALSQVGTNSNPGGNVIEAALVADYPLATLNGPQDTITSAYWLNPTSQNFIGTITETAGWQCTGGQLNNSGGLQSGNNSGNPSTPPKQPSE